MKLPASAESTPITYADAHGRQYVAVVATGGLGIGSRLGSDVLVVFSLSGQSTATLSREAVAMQPGKAAAISHVDEDPDAVIAASSGTLPPGPGHDLTIKVCSGCHAPQVVATQHLSPAEWENMVQTMAARGAVASDEELRQITNYLARAYPQTPVHSNPPAK